MKPFTLFGLVLLLAVGCATPRPRPAPLTQADVISMTKAGVTVKEIMRRIDQTATVFNLGADDVVFLRDQGVPERVINYMLDTKVRAAVLEERRRNDYENRFHYGIGFGYWRFH